MRAVARRLFNSMDLDHNGSLDCHELRLMLRTLGVDDKDISLLVASVDLDKDGSLTFDEFCKVLFGARFKMYPPGVQFELGSMYDSPL